MEAKHSPLKMFISYSHNDKSFLDELKKHLSPLERSGLVKVWCDNELIVGDQFTPEIEKNLLEADLVAFLISADFVSSYFCVDVELKSSLDRLTNSDLRIIPIIVRSCVWKDTQLSGYLATPPDGKPISNYGNRDDGWVDVVNAIKRVANNYNEIKREKINDNVALPEVKPILNPGFLQKLNDTEVVFQHIKKEQIVLDDIFVYPDLKNIKQEYEEIEKTLSSGKIPNLGDTMKKLLILGGEQGGKTSLAKMLVKDYYSQDYIPLLYNGQDINDTDINKILRKLVSEQYSNLTYDAFIGKKRLSVLIIDDYDKSGLNLRYHKKFIDGVFRLIDRLVLISDISIKYDEMKYIEFSDYSQYEIMPFGNLRRNDLIERWISIGRQKTIDITELHNEVDRITHHVDAIIRKNILPPKPIHVLTVIQVLDTVTPAKYDLTSYGHCYQSLILKALNTTKTMPADYDKYINYLSEMAYFIFLSGSEFIDDAQLEAFKVEYSKHFLVKSHDAVIKVLLASRLLLKDEGGIRFSYRYIFYFYVAKYMTDHISVEACKRKFEYLCENLHTEKNANILIFLVHHSKDQSITDEILLHASVVFDKTTEATLNVEDTKYLLGYIASISKLAIERKNIDEERKKKLKAKDKIDDLDGKSDDFNSTAENGYENRILADINRSIRLIDIIGQILRNRHASLKIEQLKELSLSAYSSGLKYLKFFLATMKEGQEPILKYLQDIFRKDATLSVGEISKEAEKIFVMLSYGVSYSVIKRIANSLGSEELVPIFAEISSATPESPAVQLINIAILLEFTKKIPKKEISTMYHKFEGNPIAQRLLQELVIQHLYLNNVDYRDRQWIAATLKVRIEAQRALQGKPEFKK